MVSNLTVENLKECFNAAINNQAKFVGVLIEMKGFKEAEVIINKIDNAEDKLNYYQNVYDENLNHKYSNGIRIVGCSYGNSFADIQKDLVG